jgi:hypothetical protein
MPYVGSDFGLADPTSLETDIYTFNFVNRLSAGETIMGNGGTIPAAGLWVISVVSGSDPDAATRLIGSPSLSGPFVSQFIGQLVANVKYLIQVTIYTSNNRTLTAYSHVLCSAPS